ncbi:UNVERIFIED_CONTAM: protein PSK SIMULATOR 3 [Sesamum radiatum]|uniref:Protein PSK SIMULATOR 3 n=1 Tax=Sesamum radiatum TaxID=300843 RepID=A0AAW2REE5_SESRA
MHNPWQCGNHGNSDRAISLNFASLACEAAYVAIKFHLEFSVTQMKYEMDKTLHWLVPIATNTAKVHHGFGWVGEWANTG